MDVDVDDGDLLAARGVVLGESVQGTGGHIVEDAEATALRALQQASDAGVVAGRADDAKSVSVGDVMSMLVS